MFSEIEKVEGKHAAQNDCNNNPSLAVQVQSSDRLEHICFYSIIVNFSCCYGDLVGLIDLLLTLAVLLCDDFVVPEKL